MQKQKFYILGHNPNTLQEVEGFLRAGANALEPDICFDAGKPGHFFVSHGTIGSNAFIPENSLVTFLTGLRALLTDNSNNFNLALIAFDIKTPSFDINEFVKIVFDNFSSHPVCDGVGVLITVGSLTHISFLNAYDQTRENFAIGIDEEKSPGEVDAGFKAQSQKSFTYANGSIIPAIKFGLFKSIMTAKGVQAAGNGDSFKLIYAWVLNSDSYIRSYMDLHIDGMIVDLHTVPHLLLILQEDHFAQRYELAQNGYNPFTQLAPPRYLLTIRTRDTHRAGTDVPVKFTLEGSAGILETTLNCDFRDVMERGDTDFLTLEGKDIGDIQSLTVAEQHSGINSDWLPEFIKLESSLIPAPLTFHYAQDEWLKFGQPITKKPD
ncbi:MAG TPA: PLAT/LH2 domain-containing protein [Pyrinomonadaceae bacterium]|jgi:hypothetical protein